jgi:uncharacterized Tic20 family protein
MSIADDLERLDRLRQSGAIDDAEFAMAKAKVLNDATDLSPDWSLATAFDIGPEKSDAATRHWALLLHFSILAGFMFPLAGLAVPIIIWQVKKDSLPGIDPHGKNAINWIISKIIYFVLSILLCMVLIGIPMLIALAIASVLFPIIAGIKANNGTVWKYPLAISFFK